MDEKIKEMAEKLAKAYQEKEEIQEFQELIKSLGKEETAAIVSTLSEDGQKLFKDTLEKALSMDAKDSEVGPESKQEVSEDAKDDEETQKEQKKAKGEDLVDDSKAAKINHQGDNSELEGQVIKSEEEPQDLQKGEAGSKDAKEDKEIAEEAAKKEVKEHEDEMHKSEDVEKGAIKELAIEALEKGELLEKMIEKLRKRGMDHDKVMDALGKKGYDVEMAKGKWADMEKAEAKVEKSIVWDSPNRRIEAHARHGQNTHYNVDGYLVKKALEKAEAKDKAGEPLAKSEIKEINDINDVIEKGYDRSEDEVKQALGIVKKSKGGEFNTSSFSEEDLAKAHNMTVEEMREVLGLPKPQAQETVNKSSEQKEDLEKAGEGSRGGKIIGHTKTGKPIYDSHDHDAHSDFTHQEHKQAAKIHEKMSDEADKKAGVLGSKEGDAHFSHSEGHMKAANKKEMATKKAPKPPKTEKFAQMSEDDHFKAKEKHRKMEDSHRAAGNEKHAEIHMHLADAHTHAAFSHSEALEFSV